jgi:TonB family protein
MKILLHISFSLLFFSCSGSKKSSNSLVIPEIWTFEEAKLRFDSIKQQFPKLYERAEWINETVSCNEETSTFSFPERGIRDMQRKILYPPEARRNGVQGKVEARYTVSKAGELTDIVILSSPSDELSNVARDILNSTQFVHAYCNKVPIASTNVFALNFTLQDQF